MIGSARLIAAALTLLVVPATTSPAKPAAKPAAKAPSGARDWTRAFSVTPEGGFRMGNPKAKITVVEYGSLTCPHCRHFAETAVKPLIEQYVRTGKASYEYRSFVLNGIDLAATLVARCGGPAHFFPMASQLYATQPTWVGKVGDLSREQQEKLDALPQGQLMLAIAKVTGLLPIAAAQGIPRPKAEACLKDEGAANGLMKMEQAGTSLGVEGTPTFFVNGKKVPAYDWTSLQPFLKGAG